MFKKYLIFLLAISSYGFSYSSYAQTFDYVNLFNNRHTISIQIEPAFFAVGDRAFDAKICSQQDNFVCISSKEFNFAVPNPNKKSPKVSTWEYQGQTYILVKEEVLEVFGQTSKVMIIESTQGLKKVNYLYSEEKGLLAISIEMEDLKQTFVSQKKYGFGNKIK